MISSFLVLVLVLSGPDSTVSAFLPQPVLLPVVVPSVPVPQHSRRTAGLRASFDDHVKNAGGGIPLVPSGNCLLFDPAQQGMLGGTTNLQDRLNGGVRYQPSYLPPTSPAAPTTTTTTIGSPSSISTSTTTRAASTTSGGPSSVLVDAQAWLEDIGIPQNFAKASSPVLATVMGRAKLIGDDAPGDIQHVLLQLPEGMHYIEGQSISVIPPGVDPANGKPHKPRLYSIASTRYGDLLDGRTVSLCVRRAEYHDPVTGLVDPTKAGVCSAFLCGATPGMAVSVAGPVGKTMILPDDPTTDIIMVATGTGIAPFRGFLHRLFMEHTVARHMFQGQAWLILGVPTTSGLLYPQELQVMQQNANGRLEINYAISREMTNAQGGKMYVQDVLTQQADKLWDRLERGANIYFCGLKGMMPGILQALEQVAISRGIDWSTKVKEYQANHQWHVEVY